MSALPSLQDLLANEHAALFVVATLGARTSASDQPDLHTLLRAAYQQHRSQRDQLRILVAEQGEEPVAALPGYRVPSARTPRDVRTAAKELAQGCASSYAAAISATSGSQRTFALNALTWCATWQVQLGAPAQPWPGARELP